MLELANDADGRLSIILAGHPKLQNSLRRPVMEEIGARTDIFSLEGIAGSQREFIHWLLDSCTEGKADSILTDEAVGVLAAKLRTPMQIHHYLFLALEAGFDAEVHPVSAELAESVLSRQIDDLEPTLTRHGYRFQDLVELTSAKPAEIRSLFSNTLDQTRAAELKEKMLVAGLPV